MKHTILNGDVRTSLRTLPDESVQCVVTSPPYWSLRDYGVEGQIGLEPTPEDHVAALVEVFREVWRVLRHDGTLWLNYGDCYAATGKSGGGKRGEQWAQYGADHVGPRGGKWRPAPAGLKPKDLVGMPWRVAFALQADGWTLRSDIIWHKPNPMPESVRDRPTKSHEYLFLLTKGPRYFYDADAIREETGNEMTQEEYQQKTAPGATWGTGGIGRHAGAHKHDGGKAHPLGRNRRTVWEILTRPFPGAHFATFPEALVTPCILAGTSDRGACPVCGSPWTRVVEARRVRRDELDPSDPRYRPNRYAGAYEGINGRGDAGYREATTTGWRPTCACDDGDPVPCTVLDPFGGSGTVAKVARDLGRSSVSIELNPEYVEIAKRRLRIGEMLETGTCEYEVRVIA